MYLNLYFQYPDTNSTQKSSSAGLIYARKFSRINPLRWSALLSVPDAQFCHRECNTKSKPSEACCAAAASCDVCAPHTRSC